MLHTRSMSWSIRRSHTALRTCRDCGETWTVDEGVGLGLRGLLGLGLTRGAFRSRIRGMPSDAVATAYADLEQQNEAVTQSRTCPKCGCVHFRDQRT